MNKQKINFFRPLVLVLAGLASIHVNAQVSALDMKTAIETALANNNGIKADSMNIQAAAYQVSLSKSAFLPQVNYSGKTEYNIAIPTQMLPGTLAGQPSKDYVPVQFGTRYGMTNSLELTQSIVNKSSRQQIAEAGINSTIARTRHTLSKEDLVYKVADAFYSLQSNAELIRLTRKDYQNMQDMLRIAKEQFEAGLLKRIDYESLRISTANKLSQLNQLEAGYEEQLTYFKYLLGLPANHTIVISDEIKGISQTAQAINNQSLQREDVKLSFQMIEAKQANLESIRAEKMPVISSWFRLGYQSQFGNLSDAFKSEYSSKNSAIGITASLSIFDGNRRKNRINIANAELEQLKFQSDYQQQLANTEYTSAKQKLEKDKQNFEIAQQNVELAEKVFESRQALYKEGVSSLIELLDAEKELTQSRDLQIKAMMNVQSSTLNLYKANGTILTDYINTL